MADEAESNLKQRLAAGAQVLNYENAHLSALPGLDGLSADELARVVGVNLQGNEDLLLDDVVEWLAHFPNLEVVLIGRDLDDSQSEQLAANEKLIVVDDVALVDDMTVEEILGQPKYAGLLNTNPVVEDQAEQ